MKSVLCYGDSNTWGSDPASPNNRFPSDVRWTGVMTRELSAEWQVAEAGLGGRTTVFERLPEPYRSGRELLVATMETHSPLDLVIILLGTNDVSMPYLETHTIIRGAGEIARIAQDADDFGPASGGAPLVLLVAPPVVGPLLPEDVASCEGAIEKSMQLGAGYEKMAAMLHCGFLNLGPIVTTSPLDGWHWEAPEHEKAGVAMAAAVREMFPT